jgi:hypothetical protein
VPADWVEALGEHMDAKPSESAGVHGRWSPASVEEIAALMDGAPFRWWIGGGLALELFSSRSWRSHGDSDVGICRRDAPMLRAWLDGFDLWVASGGQLLAWSGGSLSATRAANNVWVRRRPDGPWIIDVCLGEGDGEQWCYRRDPGVVRPWDEVVQHDLRGVPYLAPEIQLLFKSKDIRERDQQDAEEVAPMLSDAARSWLQSVLAFEHPWQALLGLGTPELLECPHLDHDVEDVGP